MKTCRTLMMAAAMAGAALAQSGHWEGSINGAGQKLAIQVDLEQAGQEWKGTINIPEQNIEGFALSDVKVNGDAVSFAMKGVPGNPEFAGKLAAGGKALSGDFTQGGNNLAFQLDRTGDPQAPKSTAVSKAVEGTWEGTLDSNGTKLRLLVKLSNQEGGPATGTLTSVDQGGVQIPITTVMQNGSSLRLSLPAIQGRFVGEVAKDSSEVRGEWTQGPGKLPLVLKRPAK